MYYNLGSIIIGLVAWGLGFLGMHAKKNISMFQISSFSCCCTALMLQFLETKRLCQIEDWSAIDDTINATCIAAGTLILVTILLNLLSEKEKYTRR